MEYLYYVIIGFGTLFFFFFLFTSGDNVPEIIHSQWSYYFPELQFSSEEFYESVKTILVSREIPNTEISDIEFSERDEFLGDRRKYLRVRSAPYSFDICAAPYGTGFFVSWWLGEDMGCLLRLLCMIPGVGGYFKRRAEIRTYYILDSQAMFREATRLAVLNAIDDMTSAKGMRALSELDRQVSSRRKVID